MDHFLFVASFVVAAAIAIFAAYKVENNSR